MHPTALANSRLFFDAYGLFFKKPRLRVVDIGSQDVNGSLRETCPRDVEYVGVDFVAGKGVDVVLTDPYKLPFQEGCADIVLSSSCFEHSEFFWVLYLEIMRILSPGGLFYLNVPSNGDFHQWPVDCWRFYPDSGKALAKWANVNQIDAVLLESYISRQGESSGCDWNDFVAVFIKGKAFVPNFPKRILHTKKDVFNGMIHGSNECVNFHLKSEDQTKVAVISQIATNHLRVN